MRFLKLSIFLMLIGSTQITFSQNFKYGKVSKEELLEKEHPLDPSANAAILYREKKALFEYTQSGSFQLVTEYFERIKIYNKVGYKWATSYVNTYNEESIATLKGTTYSLDSKNNIVKVKLGKEGIFNEKISKYRSRRNFTMPDLKEGCVIEFRYKTTSPYFKVNKFRLQEEIPINKLKINLFTIEYLVFKYQKRGWIPFKIQKDQTTRVVGKFGTISQDNYEVNMSNVPAIKVEKYAGNINNYISSLTFELNYTKFPNYGVVNRSNSWDQIVQNINERSTYNTELKKEGYFKDDIDQLISGVSGTKEKTKLIFEFVKNKMNWNNYNGIHTDEGVRYAYKNGIGNAAEINLMLTAMLRYASINANPVLVSTKSNGIPVFPTRHGFNYVISCIESDNEVILLDATNKKGEFNILDPKLLNGNGRIIRPDGSSTWVALSPKTPAINNTMITANIEPDLTLSGKVRTKVTGHFSQEMRNKFSLLSDDENLKELEKDKEGVELTNINFSDLNKLHQPISLEYDFEATDVVEEIGGKLYLTPLLFFNLKESPFKLEKRKYPVDFEYTRKNRKLISINIPEGYVVESIPENTNFSFGQNSGNFRYQISNVGNKIQLSTEISINNSLIDSSEYENLKGFYQLLIEKENENIILIKK